jgi:hypothetical protein
MPQIYLHSENTHNSRFRDIQKVLEGSRRFWVVEEEIQGDLGKGSEEEEVKFQRTGSGV